MCIAIGSAVLVAKCVMTLPSQQRQIKTARVRVEKNSDWGGGMRKITEINGILTSGPGFSKGG